MRTPFIILVLSSFLFTSCAVLKEPAPTVNLPTLAANSTVPTTSPASPTPSISASATLEPTPEPTSTSESTATEFPLEASFPSIPPIVAGQPITLTYIQMSDPSSGWGIESTGHIVRTADGAGTWQDVTPPQGAYVRSGFFALDAKDAWATPKSWCGAFIGDCQGTDQYVNAAVVWHTTNGGQSWQPGQAFSLVTSFSRDQIAYFPHLFFLNSQIGWNMAWVFATHMGEMYQELFKTSDGGATWQMQAGEVELQKSFMGAVGSFVFLDEQTGWAVENGSYDNPASVRKTTDGGRSWALVSIPNQDRLSGDPNSSCTVEIAYQTDSKSGVGFGCSGKGANFFDLTHDAGQTWLTWSGSSSIRFLDDQAGWRLYSTASGQPNQLQQTTDGGKSWQMLKMVSWQSAQLDFANRQTGWAIVTSGDVSALVHTTDGGKTWKEIKPVGAASSTAASHLNLMSIHMFTENAGWVRAFIPDGGAFLLHTVDGGKTWKDVTPEIASSGYINASYLDENTAWVSSSNPTSGQSDTSASLERTIDGGRTWQVITQSLPQPFLFASTGMTFLNQEEGWTEIYDAGAGQAQIQIYTTQDGGISWSQVMLGSPEEGSVELPGTLHLCNICSDSFYYDPVRQFITYGDLASDSIGKVRASIAFDQGKTWKDLELPFPSTKFADALVAPQLPVFFNQNDGVLPVGLIKLNPDGSHAYDVLATYTTHDGGLNWTPNPVFLENVGNLVSSHSVIDFVSPLEAFVACGPDLCFTSDGTQTWQPLHSNLNFTYSETIKEYVQQFDFISVAIGWAISTNGDTYSLWKTSDGGRTWEEVNYW